MIFGTIAQRPTKMLIDSGASLTLINSDLFYQLPYYIRQNARYPSSKFQIHLADKSRLEVQKILRLPITIANHTRQHIVHVVPRLWRPCIIGNDFIQKHNLQIDGGRQRVYFKGLVKGNSRTQHLDPRTWQFLNCYQFRLNHLVCDIILKISYSVFDKPKTIIMHHRSDIYFYMKVFSFNT